MKAQMLRLVSILDWLVEVSQWELTLTKKLPTLQPIPTGTLSAQAVRAELDNRIPKEEAILKEPMMKVQMKPVLAFPIPSTQAL